MSAVIRNAMTAAQFARELAQEAGARLMGLFGHVEASAKGRFDLVTDADTAVEALILERIRDRFPAHQVIAEESSGQGATAIDEHCWAVDPLDGTVNFALGIPFFAVSLALLYRGDPMVGCVYDPVRRELFHAERSQGGFVNGRRLRISPDTLAAAPVGVSSGFLEQQVRGSLDSSLLPFFERYGKVRILGSQALHLCYVAAGRLRAAVSWEARLWDDAAGALLVQEAGGRYSGFRAERVFPLQAGSPVLAGQAIHSVAGAQTVHGEIVSLLAGTPAAGSSSEEEVVA